MELEELLNNYQYVSREELEKMQDTYNLDLLESKVEDRNQELMINKTQGREHVEAGPLVQVLSVQFLPYDRRQNKSIMVYGRIYAEFNQINSGEIIIHDLFNRGSDDPETLSSSGGFLTLTGPDANCYPHNLFMPLYETEIFVDVRDAPKKVAVKDSFVLEDATENGDYEQVNIKYFCGTGGILYVRYVTMPFAVLCCLEVEFYRKKRDQDKDIIRHVVNVSGKIVARYGKTCGNFFASDGCTLFEKQSQEYEQVIIDKPNMLRLSRSWLSMPAYSSLILDVDLLVFGTKRHIFQRLVELLPQRNRISDEAFAIDDVVMNVNLICFSCDPGWNRVSNWQLEYKSSDDESSPETSISRIRRRHGSVPFASPAVEVFSVFIGRQKMIKALRLFGTIEVSFRNHQSYIFNTSEDNALELLEHSRTLPIVDDSRIYDDDGSVGIKFDLKDIDGNLFIKGFAAWDIKAREAWPSRLDNQVCSVIQGQHGFAALHYSFFPLAFHATVEFNYKLRKSGSFGVYGSLIAQYDTYDYSTRFKRDYFRMVLFKRVEQNLVPLKADGKIPISRSMIVVPLDSALIIEVDLVMVSEDFRQRLFEVVAIEIGASLVSMEMENYWIDIHVKWKT